MERSTADNRIIKCSDSRDFSRYYQKGIRNFAWKISWYRSQDYRYST